MGNVERRSRLSTLNHRQVSARNDNQGAESACLKFRRPTLEMR